MTTATTATSLDIPGMVRRPTFGQRVRARRKSMGLTRRDLATASGISVNALGEIETGAHGAGREAILALVRALAQPAPEETSVSLYDRYRWEALRDALDEFFPDRPSSPTERSSP